MGAPFVDGKDEPGNCDEEWRRTWIGSPTYRFTFSMEMMLSTTYLLWPRQGRAARYSR
jgi:hypothetical protein